MWKRFVPTLFKNDRVTINKWFSWSSFSQTQVLNDQWLLHFHRHSVWRDALSEWSLSVFEFLRPGMDEANLVPRVFVPLDQRLKNERLWEQLFWSNKGDNPMLAIRSHNSLHLCACLKWMPSESLVFLTAGQGERRLWERDCDEAKARLLEELLRKRKTKHNPCWYTVEPRYFELARETKNCSK